MCACVCTHISWTCRNPFTLTCPTPGTDARGSRGILRFSTRASSHLLTFTTGSSPSMGALPLISFPWKLICFQPGPSCPGVQKTPEQSRSWVGVGVEGTPRWNMGVAWKGQNSGPQLGEPAPALRPLREKQVCWSQGTSSPGVLPSSITHSVVSSSAS